MTIVMASRVGYNLFIQHFLRLYNLYQTTHLKLVSWTSRISGKVFLEKVAPEQAYLILVAVVVTVLVLVLGTVKLACETNL